MRNNNVTSSSVKFAVYLILLLLLTSCSYPSINLHHSMTTVSGSASGLQIEEHQDANLDESQLEQDDKDASSDELTNDQQGYIDEGQMESIDTIDDNVDQAVDGQHDDEEEQNKEDAPMKKIAITFDDGPDLNYTPRILDILKDKDVMATFYVVGMQINKYPDVLQRIDEEGHLIGNHSYYHPNFTKLSKKELEKEINDTDEQIFTLIGHVPTTVRPPYGSINDKVKQQLLDMGKETILWNIDPRDWDGTSVNDMFDNIIENARDGGNILLHSFGSKHVENTVELLPRIIDELRNQGYQFVTVDELS